MAIVQTMHVGEYGTVFKITIKERDVNDELQIVNISTMTEAKVTFEKGDDGNTIVRDLVFLTDGSDGILKYVFVDGDLDFEGRWSWQAYIILSSGKWYTLKDSFYVDNIIA